MQGFQSFYDQPPTPPPFAENGTNELLTSVRTDDSGHENESSWPQPSDDEPTNIADAEIHNDYEENAQTLIAFSQEQTPPPQGTSTMEVGFDDVLEENNDS